MVIRSSSKNHIHLEAEYSTPLCSQVQDIDASIYPKFPTL
jgi:hypothetical protein